MLVFFLSKSGCHGKRAVDSGKMKSKLKFWSEEKEFSTILDSPALRTNVFLKFSTLLKLYKHERFVEPYMRSIAARNYTGDCSDGGLYVISRHSTIDHAELSVLETVSKTICMDPSKLYHTAAHGSPVFEHLKSWWKKLSSFDLSFVLL